MGSALAFQLRGYDEVLGTAPMDEAYKAALNRHKQMVSLAKQVLENVENDF